MKERGSVSRIYEKQMPYFSHSKLFSETIRFIVLFSVLTTLSKIMTAMSISYKLEVLSSVSGILRIARNCFFRSWHFILMSSAFSIEIR